MTPFAIKNVKESTKSKFRRLAKKHGFLHAKLLENMVESYPQDKK